MSVGYFQKVKMATLFIYFFKKWDSHLKSCLFSWTIVAIILDDGIILGIEVHPSLKLPRLKNPALKHDCLRGHLMHKRQPCANSGSQCATWIICMTTTLVACRATSPSPSTLYFKEESLAQICLGHPGYSPLPGISQWSPIPAQGRDSFPGSAQKQVTRLLAEGNLPAAVRLRSPVA